MSGSAIQNLQNCVLVHELDWPKYIKLVIHLMVDFKYCL